jgi:hypothetical protein
MPRTPFFTEEEIDRLAKKYKDGATLSALAKEGNVSVPTISVYLKRAGVTIRPRGRPKKNEVTFTVTSKSVYRDEEKTSDDPFEVKPNRTIVDL